MSGARNLRGVTRRAFGLSAAATALLNCTYAAADEQNSVFVRSVGEGERVWVLLHPFGASGRFWDARAAALANEHGVTILCPDLPSHGRSVLVERFDYADAARAVEAAIARWPAPELIVGASSGGIVALLLASRGRAPVSAIGVGDAFSRENIDAMRRQAIAQASDEFVTLFVEQGDAQHQAIARHYGDLAAFGSAPLLDADCVQALAERVLIINGGRDSFFRPDSAHRLAASIPGSMLLFEPDAEHLEPLGPRFRARTWATIAAFRSVATGA